MKLPKRIMCAILACLTLALCAPAASAAGFSDTKGHWAESYINDAVKHGYVNGYGDNTFAPSKAITRAEFCKMINSALGLKAQTTLAFTDISSGKWYYSDIQKAVAAGYIAGYEDNTFKGDSSITRQEAAVVLSRITSDPSLSKDISALKDSSKVASWALSGVKHVYAKGYMTGDNLKMFNPQGNLTRAEAVKILETLLSKETIVKDNLTVATSGQVYADKIYVGSVIISDKIGSGSVTFSGCRILGTLLINGGGSSGIRLYDTGVSSITADSKTSPGIACAGASTVNSTYISAPCSLAEGEIKNPGQGFKSVTIGSGTYNGDISLTGAFENITLSAPAGLKAVSAEIDSLTINAQGKNAVINLDKSSLIQNAYISAACSFKGEGTIKKATESVSGVSYEKKPESLITAGSETGSFLFSSSPSNGQRGVKTDTAVVISSSLSFTCADGSSVSSLYLQSKAIELRRGSESGTKVMFLPEISGKTITLYPTSELSKDEDYYLVINKGMFKNSSGALNASQTVHFSTGSSGALIEPSVHPADSAEDFPTWGSIKLDFGVSLYKKDGGNITSSYVISDMISLRKGSLSGAPIDFSVSLSSDRSVITITPESELSSGTKYYVTVKEGSAEDKNGKGTAEVRTYFTTSEYKYMVPMVSPSQNSEDIACDTSFELTFDERLLKANGASLTSSYLEDEVITLRRGSRSGSKVSVSCDISSDDMTITVTPSKDLDEDTSYYLEIAEESLMGRTYDYVPPITYYFRTEGSASSSHSGLDPVSTDPENGERNVSEKATVTLSYDYKLYDEDGSSVTASYIEREAISIRRGSSSGTKVSFTAGVSSTGKSVILSPDSRLSPGQKYYVTVNEGAFTNLSGEGCGKYTFSFTCEGNSLEPSETYPENGDTGVSRLTAIEIGFDERVYSDEGKSLTSSYAEDAFEIRRGSTSGTRVSFSASISSTDKVIILYPDSALSEGYKYYVILNDGALTNGDGESFGEYIFSFEVGEEGPVPTISPSSGKTGVETNTKITLSFPSKVYRSSSGSSMTVSHIEDKLEIREGSNSTSARNISFTPSVSSTGKVVTLTLNEYLKSGTKYYIYAPKNTFYNSSGTGSDTISSYFTTKSQSSMSAPTMSPSNGSSGLSADISDIRLVYSESFYTSSGASVTGDYLQKSFEIREGSSTGASVPFTASLSSKTVTLKPSQPLKSGTKYYVKASSGIFKTASGLSSPSLSYTFETAAPTLELSESHNKESAEITVKYDLKGGDGTFKITRSGLSQPLREGFTPSKGSGSFTQALSGLSSGQDYTVTVTLTYGSGKSISRSISFATDSVSTDCSLSSLLVRDSSGSYTAALGKPSGSAAEARITGALVPLNGRVYIKAIPKDSRSKIEINGQEMPAGGEYELEVLSGSLSAEIKVTAENGSFCTYTLTADTAQ